MSVACTICYAFRGHNQDEHNEVYEEAINDLRARVRALEALSNNVSSGQQEDTMPTGGDKSHE